MAASMYASQFSGYHYLKSIKLRPLSDWGIFSGYLLPKTLRTSTDVKENSFFSKKFDSLNGIPSATSIASMLPKDSKFKILNVPRIYNHNFHIHNHTDQFNKFLLLRKPCKTNQPNRNSSNESNDGNRDKKDVMHLMDFPEIVWPSLIKSLRNWILSNLIITPYFDREFNLADFIDGSKKAFEMVTECLSESNFDKLQGLVAPEAIEEVKRNISQFSVQKRQELRMLPEDIYFSFPYQVGVMFSDDDENQKRFVEITMCYHVLQGLTELKSQGVTPPINMGMMPEYRDKIHICNYRFIREFSKGVEGEWTINKLNHFKPSDYIT